MVMVRLLHQSIICQSPVKNISSQGETGFGGGSSNNTSNNVGYNPNEARTRESCSVWDEEW